MPHSPWQHFDLLKSNLSDTTAHGFQLWISSDMPDFVYAKERQLAMHTCKVQGIEVAIKQCSKQKLEEQLFF
jgi:hypothetical protein